MDLYGEGIEAEVKEKKRKKNGIISLQGAGGLETVIWDDNDD